MLKYLVFDHTADLGIQVFGSTIQELFVNGAYAVFDLIADMDQVQLKEEHTITAAGSDWGELWVNYLRECLYAFNGRGLLCHEFSILSINKVYVAAHLRGEVFDPSRHQIKQEIKAVTYHQASVIETPQGWIGKVIFDV
jgi:SHS2 domain-containing protein